MLYPYFLPSEVTCLWERKVLLKPNAQHSWDAESLGQHCFAPHSSHWVILVQMFIRTGRCNYPVRHQSWCDGGKPMADSSGCCCLLVEATVKDECCFSIPSHLWLVGAFSAVGSCQFMCVLPTLSSSLPSWQSYARMEVFCADTLTGVELTAMMGTS